MRNYKDLATRAEFSRQYQLAAEYWQLAAVDAQDIDKNVAKRRATKCKDKVAQYLRGRRHA